MNYRALGTWLESDYVIQEGRPGPITEFRVTANDIESLTPIPPRTVAIKRFHWTQAVTCRRTGTAITLEYGVLSTIPVAMLENLSVQAKVERDALGTLHAMIDEAVAGRGYIRKVTMAECLVAVQSAMIQGWVEQGGFTEAWRGDLEASIQTANRKYREIIEACRAIGAQPSPAHDAWGWLVEIEPLTVPRSALLVMPGAV